MDAEKLPFINEDIEEEKEPFIIDTPEKAEWALKKIAEIERSAEAYINVCKAQIDHYKKLAEKKEREVEDSTHSLRTMLAHYIRSKGAPIRKAKTRDILDLPSGKVYRYNERHKMVPDKDRLIELYEDSPYVDYVPKLLWEKLKSNFEIIYDDNGEPQVVDKDTGELVDGVDIEYVPEKVEVKTNEQ